MPLKLAGIVVVVAVALGACSSDGDSDKADPSKPDATAGSTTPSTIARPAGPIADVSQEITGGAGPFLPSGESAPKFSAPPPAGYVLQEFVGAGTAISYQAQGELTKDGMWKFVPDGEAPYRTRVAVRRPEKPEDFSGTVIVEWLNVSGGVDTGPDWDMLAEEIVRAGHAWVGVTAQFIGAMGGRVAVEVPEPGGTHYAGQGLKKLDPERYGSLDHPGDGFAFDIYTQVARAVRQGGALLGGAQPTHVVAAGESQSAAALVTYYNGVAPLTKAFDGYFVHSRGAGPLPLAEPGKAVGITDSIGRNPTLFRTDLDEPVLDIQAENDTGLLRSLQVRQPDTDTFRLWEMAGTAHADAKLLGSLSESIGCSLPVNNGPMHLIAKGALHALDEWLRTGTPPPSAPRFETTGGENADVKRDSDGIVLGGIRTPMIDTPVDELSGVAADGPIVCILSGSTKPLPDARLAELYESRADYVEQYAADTDRAIKAGHLLEGDRDAVIEYSQPDRISE